MNSRKFAVVVAALLAVVACSKTSRKLGYVEKGNRLAAQGKYEDAEILYRKALQIDPHMADAYYRIGLVQLKEGKLIPAYQAFNRAATEDQKDKEIIKEAAEINLDVYLGDPRRPKVVYDRLVHYTGLLAALDPNSPASLRLKGYVALLDRRTADAVDLFRRASQANSNDPDLALGLTRALYANGQDQEAEATARSLIAQHKDFGPIYDLLFVQYRNQNRPNDAEQILVLKSRNNPKNIADALELARFYEASHNVTARDAVVNGILQHHGDFDQPRLAVGNFYLSTGRPSDALAQFQQGLGEDPQHKTQYQKASVNALLALGRTDEANRLVASLAQQNPKDVEVRAVHASLLIKQGKVEQGLAEYEAAVTQQPDNAVLRYNYGLALSGKGDTQGARQQFEKARSLSPGYVQPRFALAALAMNNGQSREALGLSDEILRVQPGNAAARLLHATALVNQARYDEGRRELERLIADQPKFWDAQIALGNFYLARSQPAEAEQIYRKVYQANPGSAPALAALSSALFAQHKPDEALRLVSEQAAKPDASPELRGLLAQTETRAGKLDLAEAQYKQLLAQFPNNAVLWLRMGEVYQLKSDLPGAVAQFQKAAQLAPRDAMTARELGDALQLSGRYPEAVVAYRNALSLRPNDPLTMNNLAFAEAEEGQKLDDALTLAKKAVSADANNVVFQDTLGWVYLKQGHADSALPILARAVTQAPNDPSIHYHFAAVLFAKGDRARARQELETAVAKKPLPQDQAGIKELLAKLS
ncbi:MAG: tetratricopeptide repeat protein [Acidobacteriaceae bacterium]|nr:tetratricopeptide repeat protein [Acidobacteriaceae bacterium]